MSNNETRIRAATIGELVAELVLELGDDQDKRTASDIIAALLDVPRFWPASNAGDAVDVGLERAALAAVGKIRAGAPFAYAVGRACFRHLTLEVDERVLIPRPETEMLVEEVLAIAKADRLIGAAADVGTGSGAIALSLASEGSFSHVVASDVSSDALAVARRNAAALAGALRCPVELRHGSLLDPYLGDSTGGHEMFAAIVSNPPYIAYHEAAELPSSVRDWEPALALFSGSEGMAAIAAIVRDAAGLLLPGGVLALEVDTRRASIAAEMVAVDMRYRDVSVRLDLTGRERFVMARRA